MKVEVVQDARRKWNIDLHFCFLLTVAWPYIYMYTRASAYAHGLLGEIIHRTYGASGRHRVA